MSIKYKKKLTVFLITNNYRPYSSGITHSIENLAAQLKKFGHHPVIITLDFLGKHKDEEDVIRLYSPIRFTYKKNHMAIPIMPQKELTHLIQNLRPDILHVHHPFLLGKVGLSLSKKCAIPIVFTYHTQYEKYLHYVPLPKKITFPVIKKVVDVFCHKVDGIIAPVQMIKNDLCLRNIKTPIQVIPSSIDPLFYTKKANKKLNKPIKLLTVSRFAKEKNIEFLLRVVQKLDQNIFNLTLIGYGAHEEFLKNYAYQKLGLSQETVKFIIKPEKQELVDWYQKADLFLFASKTETQGMVLAEAMASGVPVIALDAPGAHDIIKNGFNGYLVSNENEMVTEIVKMMNNQKEYNCFTQHAWQTAQQYNTELLTQKMINFYYQVISIR